MGERQPTLIVAYGLGTASPSAVVKAAEHIARVVFVFDSGEPHSRAMARVLRSLVMAFDVSTGYATVVEELKKLDAQGVVTFSESCLGLASRLGVDLGLGFHSPVTVDRLTDKALQREILNRAGLSSVRGVTVESATGLRRAVEAVGVPFVVKPLAGFGSRCTLGCWKPADILAVEQSLRAYGSGPWVVEQMMPAGRHPSGPWLGDYVSVESAVIEGRVRHLALTDKLPLVRPFREKGAIMPGSLERELRDRVLELASGAINALGVRSGLLHTEVKLAADGPQIIEVNGRLGGEVANLIRRSAGFDPIVLAIQIALGMTDSVGELVHHRIAVHYAVLAPEGVFEVVSNPDSSAFLKSGEAVWRVETQHRRGSIVDSSRGTLDAIARVYADAVAPGDIERMVARFDRIAHRYVEMRDR